MNTIDPIRPETSVPLISRFHGFETLMPFRVREVLLVSSLYDSFILEEDGQITELLLEEYQHLNLWYAPRLTRVSTAEEALAALNSNRRFDLVISTMRVGETDPFHFANQVANVVGPTPIALLGYDHHDLERIEENRARLRRGPSVVRPFIWSGDARILLAIVNLMEDALNAEHDTRAAGVEAIIVVEDSIRFASAYLPILYTELLLQSQETMAEAVNVSQRVMRMRARPKILWCETFEEACETYERYRPTVLGLISDVKFPRDGRDDPDAGLALTRFVRVYQPDLPVLLISANPSNRERAQNLNVSFVHKESHRLIADTREFMSSNFGFGPFTFRTPDGTPVAEAQDLRELQSRLTDAPPESLEYHATREHLSKWLKARAEFRLARRMRERCAAAHRNGEALRESLLETLRAHRRAETGSVIADFSPDTFDPATGFARLGGGSIGGKARGLAFLNSLLWQHDQERPDWPGVNLTVPPAVVIATDYFDQFLEMNGLKELAHEAIADDAVREAFDRARLPFELMIQLESVLDLMDYPLAVRSSSLLEDSVDQPFAGIYETYMVASAAATKGERLSELAGAIKRVYGSAFMAHAKAYLSATPLRPGADKMAVIVQRLVGRRRGPRFYPTISGVARSYNYYPFRQMKAEDGVAFLALGLGAMIVEGRGALRFCPKRPNWLPQFATVDDTLKNTQREFYALSFDAPPTDFSRAQSLERYTVNDAEQDGALSLIASTYSSDNHTIHEGTSRPGPRVLTFAGLLHHDEIPLPEILTYLLELGSWGMSSPVEVEFAVDLPERRSEPVEFACLQMRPLVVMREAVELPDFDSVREHTLCSSRRALGNGRIDDLLDIVYVDPQSYDVRHGPMTATHIGEINARLAREKRRYVLIGPGRWGSADHFLGVPVNWGQISGVRVLIETALAGRHVEPSEGSHFFHNLTSLRVAYMSVNGAGNGFLNWGWLREQPATRTFENGLRWLRVRNPMNAIIDGRSNRGVVYKPGEGNAQHDAGLGDALSYPRTIESGAD